MNRIAMPSPRGTNQAGLFVSIAADGRLVATNRGSGPMARDDNNLAERPVRNAMALLRKIALKCTPEEWANLHGSLRGMSGDPDDESDDPENAGAADNPKDFPGMPKTGAMDSKAAKLFAERHPDIARVGTGGVSYGDRSFRQTRRASASASAEASFAEMFPGAGDIKFGA